MRLITGIRPVTAIIVALATMFMALPAPASSAGVTQISGQAVFDGDSTDPGFCDFGEFSLFTLRMTGDLDGCWYTTSLTSTETPSGVYMERGTEKFVGTWLGTPVEFTTTYKFTAKFDSDGNEIHGRCAHPIVGGDVQGRVDFKDDVATGIFYYRGHLA